MKRLLPVVATTTLLLFAFGLPAQANLIYELQATSLFGAIAAPGVDYEVGIDNNGFFVQPGTFSMKWPRVRRATVRADGGEGYVDLGPGKRAWSMVILCINDLNTYDGTSTGLTGQNYRDSLVASYSKVAQTIPFQDPLGSSFQVHFDEYAEHTPDLHVQQVQLATGGVLSNSYLVAIELVEA